MTRPIKPFAPKYGDEELDYTYDWSNDLVSGESVSSVEVTATSPLSVGEVSTEGTVTTFWISGGGTVSRDDTRVNLLATTSEGRKVGVSIRLPVKGR